MTSRISSIEQSIVKFMERTLDASESHSVLYRNWISFQVLNGFVLSSYDAYCILNIRNRSDIVYFMLMILLKFLGTDYLLIFKESESKIYHLLKYTLIAVTVSS